MLWTVDLDTIDYSNLNRQFLFRDYHVKRSKAKVACEAVLTFPHDSNLRIEAAESNIKDKSYDHDFFEGFALVLNALDNVDARRHVNRTSLADSQVPPHLANRSPNPPRLRSSQASASRLARRSSNQELKATSAKCALSSRGTLNATSATLHLRR